MMAQSQPTNIIGAGLAGSLLAVFLTRRGYKVNVYERSQDMRINENDQGLSLIHI